MFRRIKHIATTVADIPRLVKGEHIKLMYCGKEEQKFRRIKHIATTGADIPRLVKGENIKLKAQQEGDPDLEYQTALYMYEQKEDNEAFDFMKKAAQKGHIEAQYQL